MSSDEMIVVNEPKLHKLDLDPNSKLTNAYFNENGRKLLQYAREGDSEGVLALLNKGTPITCDWLGTSPLHLAVMNRHHHTCEVLLRAGVNKDGRTKVDRTPLHFAAYDGISNIAKLLLLNYAEVDCKDLLLMTPLHWAVERGHIECVRLLLQYGADPHAVNKFYKSPLMTSIEMQWHEVTEMLIKVERPPPKMQAAKREPKQKCIKTAPTFSFDSDCDILDLNSDKSLNDDSVNEIEPDSVDTDKEAQSAIESLLPQINESPNEATLELLKEHGITLIPNDNTNTINSAIQSGRKVVLSDAGKLVLSEVSLKESPKSVEIKKRPIILPSAKMKKIFICSNQFINSQNKPNILQKLPLESLKTSPVNFVKLPGVKFMNNSVKSLPSPAKSIYSPTKICSPISKDPNSMKDKIVKLKGGNINKTMKLIVKKNLSLSDNMDLDKQTLYKDILSIDMNQTIDDCVKMGGGSQCEISRLKSELQLAHAKIQYYKKALQERDAELAVYKCRNRDSFMGVETNSID